MSLTERSDACRDVDDLAGDALERRLDQRLDRRGGVVDVEPVAARVPVAVDSERLAAERLGDEARDDLLGMLPRPVVVERSDDHDRQVVRDPVAVREAVGARLGRGVRAARLERVPLVHRRVLRRAVHLARGDEQEALDGTRPDRVEEDLRPLDVRRHELGRAVADRLLDVGLRRGIHDHVDPADDLVHQAGVADVAVDELESRMAHHVGEVLDARCIRERVERDHLVRRVLEQVPDEVRRDEPGAAGDEHATHRGTPIAVDVCTSRKEGARGGTMGSSTLHSSRSTT